jgi:hypothetical protein
MEKKMEDNNCNSFDEDVLELRKRINICGSSIIEFTNDNSFDVFIRSFTERLIENISNAIKNQKIEIFDGMKNDIFRFMSVIESNLVYKIVFNEVGRTIVKSLLFLRNWMRMLEEQGLYGEYNLSDQESKTIIDKINELNEFLSLSSSTEDLIKLVKRLESKAQKLLGFAPMNFNISRSFMDAINKSERKDTNFDERKK